MTEQLTVPGPGEVHLWLRETARIPREPDVLDAEEQARAARFVRPQDRDRYAASHLLLRRILARYTETAPEQLRFTREVCPCCGGPHGRPALADLPSAPHFSLSHAGPLAMVAVAGDPVGADVEQWPAADAIDGLVDVLHPDEQAELKAVGNDLSAFSRLWTRKEAYLKGIGTGLGRAMDLDYVGDRQPAPVGWSLADTAAPPASPPPSRCAPTAC
ncbi:4'-phosphopantetheinyl transferase superfamily protein [Streptacidiphilus sp. 4-A2]|nr:4'-phosphopantetheinyl transferase superfamily protein [Streptacidiphilus sp. 4-A2]